MPLFDRQTPGVIDDGQHRRLDAILPEHIEIFVDCFAGALPMTIIVDALNCTALRIPAARRWHRTGRRADADRIGGTLIRDPMRNAL